MWSEMTLQLVAVGIVLAFLLVTALVVKDMLDA